MPSCDVTNQGCLLLLLSYDRVWGEQSSRLQPRWVRDPYEIVNENQGYRSGKMLTYKSIIEFMYAKCSQLDPLHRMSQIDEIYTIFTYSHSSAYISFVFAYTISIIGPLYLNITQCIWIVKYIFFAYTLMCLDQHSRWTDELSLLLISCWRWMSCMKCVV